MNISVRVLSARAQSEIKRLQAQVAALQAQVARGGAAAATGIGSKRHVQSLQRWGNQLQWTGRQLQYNWTLPLLLAGGAAAMWQLQNEKAFTHVAKVYGDTASAAEFFMKRNEGLTRQMAEQKATRVFAAELEALGEAFEAISSHYGVQQKEVIEVAGAWAAAGSSGVALAKSVDLTMKAVILGNMEAAKATEALIAIQAQYSLNTEELGLTLAQLNAIENQTGIQMQGLIEGFARAAGVAREAGVDVRHLGAMLAALVPATGTASQAGNALKTIISRLMSPTREAAQVMNEMGLEITAMEWQGATAVERLQMMSKEFRNLSDSQKQVASSVIASRWQINKFNVLMRELNPSITFYEKALEATASKAKVFAQMHKELNEVLSSNPKRLEIIWYTLQNAAADIIQPMIPYILYLANAVKNMVTAFSELDPAMQKFILLGALALAFVGPAIRYFGSLMTLVWALAVPLRLLGKNFAIFGHDLLEVDGKMTKVRRGIFATIAAFLAWPFRKIAAGFGGLLALFGRLALGIRAIFVAMAASVRSIFVMMWASLRTITLLWSGAISTAVILWRGGMIGIFTVMRTVLVATYTGMWKALAVITALGRAAIFRFLLSIPRMLLAIGAAIFAALSTPWALAALAVISVLVLLRDQIAQVWNNVADYFSNSNNALVSSILDAWYALPEGVRNALTAVARIVQSAALEIYEWFSFINPFARHSPSLVENVTAGMTRIVAEFGRLRGIGAHVKAAYGAIKSFGAATRDLLQGAASFDALADRKLLAEFAPGALDEFDRLSGILKVLNRDMAALEARINAQERVTARWEARLDAVNNKLERQQDKLQRLQNVASEWADKLAAAQDRLATLADTPIKGMRAMEDAIFANEMAQKKLRLEMLKMEDAGNSLDDLRKKMALMQGAQEKLFGQRQDLRAAGAGSEILGVYDQQIAALEAQQKAVQKQSAPLAEMSSKLEELQRQAEIMDLEKSLKFDPLTRAIQRAAFAIEEMPFDKIMAGIRAAKADIATYSAEVEKANKAVERQQQVVDRVGEARDRVQSKLDREKQQLESLQNTYQKLSEAIRDVEAAMNDVASAANQMKQAKDAKKGPKEYVSPGLQNFRDAAGGEFANVGGAGIPMRKNWKSQVGDIKKFTDQLARETAGMFEGLDPFGPIKKAWGRFKGWMSDQWNGLKAGFKDFFSKAFDGIEFGGIEDSWNKLWGKLKEIGNLFAPDLTRIWDAIKKAGKDVWKQIGPEVKKFKDLVEPLKDLFSRLWPIIKITAAILGGILLGAIKIVASVFSHTLGPVLDMIIGVIKNVIKVIRGILEFVVGVFTGNWKLAWQGIKDIVSGVFGAIWEIIKGAGKILWGIVKGIVVGIWEFFVWLWDKVKGQLSEWWGKIIGTVWGALKGLGKWVWNNVLKPVWNWIKSLWTDYVKPGLAAWWEGIKNVWSRLKQLGQWIWNSVLKPVWNWIKSLWTDYVKPALSWWWEGIKNVWSRLKQLGQWVWDNVLKPVFQWFKDVWNIHIQPFLRSWWDKLTNAWSKLKEIPGWIWDKVLQPIKQKFVDIWHAIRDWFQENGHIIVKPIKSVVNLVIGAINTMIRGINKIADVLPGLDWHINLIPKLEMASGGAIPKRFAGRGMKTSGARAIIGEGKANYPEYVIPTDPTYRNRARKLMMAASSKIGMSAIPQHADGGILGTLGNVIGSAKSLAKGGFDWMKGNLEKLASTVFAPFKALINSQINNIDWRYGREPTQFAANQVFSLVTSLDKAFSEKIDKIGVAPGGAPVRGGDWERTTWRGHQFNVRTVRMIQAAERILGTAFHITQGSYSTSVAASGSTHAGGGVFDSTYPNTAAAQKALRTVGFAAWIRTPSQGPWPTHIHAVALGDVTASASAKGQMQSYLSGGIGLKRGGIVRRRSGGVLANIGEGRYDEAVVPLSRNWRGGNDDTPGETHLHFHGNLSFPNINTGEDAKVLIENLESLAGGAA